ncbi:hypothetical protein ABK040_007290 [Willaertia magna]
MGQPAAKVIASKRQCQKDFDFTKCITGEEIDNEEQFYNNNNTIISPQPKSNRNSPTTTTTTSGSGRTLSENKRKYKFSKQMSVLEDFDLPYTQCVRLLILGDPFVGKTSLIQQMNQTFSKDIPMTVGINEYTFINNNLNKNIKITIWDTAGQERFQRIVENMFKGADGIFIAASVDNEQSFSQERISKIIKKGREANNKMKFVFLATKCDLRKSYCGSEMIMSKEKVDYLFKQVCEDIPVVHTSAFYNEGVTEAIETMIESCIN